MSTDIHWERTDIEGPEVKCFKCGGSGKEKCYVCAQPVSCSECIGVGTTPKVHGLDRQVCYFIREHFPQIDSSGRKAFGSGDAAFLRGACAVTANTALRKGLLEILNAIEEHGEILLVLTN